MTGIRSLLGRGWHWVLQPALVIGILLAGFIVARNLGAARKPPAKTERAEYAPLTRTQVVQRADHPLVISATGTLRARSRVDLVSQVGGKAVSVHPELRPGGVFEAGERLVQVERRDYELSLMRAEAELSAALGAHEYEEAKADADVAQWEQLMPGQEMPPLVARGPQLAEAEARVRSSRAAIAQAELDLARTSIRAEFDGRVVSSAVERGEVIGMGQSLAVLYGTERFEVPVPLELGRADRLRAAGQDLMVRVRLELGERRLEIPGRLARIEGEVDARSRQVMAVVEILSSDLPPRDREALMPGLFLDIEFEAGRLRDATRLPAGSLKNEGRLLLVEDGRLRLLDPEVVWRDDESVYLAGLPESVEIVTSTLDTITEGMAVRTSPEPQR
jgi:RND family efflux transporter MFP subunit